MGKKKPLIYVAGPMRGHDKHNFPAFDAAAEMLRGRGWEVVSPADHDRELGFDEDLPIADQPVPFDLGITLLWDLDQVRKAEAIYLLRGWQHSTGANLELGLAQALGKDILFESPDDAEPQKMDGGAVLTTSGTGGQKGSKLARYDLIPTEPLRLLAELYGRGAQKYDDDNWRRGYDWRLSYAALQRHLNQFWAGEDIDPEMQVPHVINAAWHCFTLAQFMIDHPGYDSRFITGRNAA
jgi:hypothetical protein